MPITFNCPKCNAAVSAPDAYAGKRGKCNKCGQLNRIPSPAIEPPPIQAIQAIHAPSPPQQVVEFDWDAIAGALLLPAFLCSLFAACVPMAAVAGMVLSAAAIPIASKVRSTFGSIGGVLLSLLLLGWCGLMTIGQGIGGFASSNHWREIQKRAEAQQKWEEETPGTDTP